MKRRRESALERWAVRLARYQGVPVSKLTDPTGIMDHVFWVPGGRPLLVEFKDPNGVTAPGRAKLQTYYRKLFKRLGYTVVLVETKEQFLKEFKND